MHVPGEITGFEDVPTHRFRGFIYYTLYIN